MSKKGRSHLRGERGQLFADQIRGLALERVLYVRFAWTSASTFTWSPRTCRCGAGVIHNALGETQHPVRAASPGPPGRDGLRYWAGVVTPTFEIDMFQTGFDQLCRAIDDATARTQAQVVWVGMEPTSHYFENLAQHLLARPSRCV